jgi:hypothetical protein
MGIHLAAIIASLNVNLSLIDKTDDLDVGWSPGELDTSQSAFWDQTCALRNREREGQQVMVKE